jgi:hypothetical protein
MNSVKPQLLRDLAITRDHWDTPVRLRLIAYTRFCQHMDDLLNQLVVQWDHLAAPCARRVKRRVGKLARK